MPRIPRFSVPIFDALQTSVFANEVKMIQSTVLREYGVLTWPGEINLAPDAMHDAIKQKGRWILQ